MHGVSFIRSLKGHIRTKGLNAFRLILSEKSQGAKIEVPVLDAVARSLSQPSDPLWFTLGICMFSGLVFLLGAAPELLPHAFLLFAAICLPWRAINFGRRKWTFFLVDYCYFATNIVAAYFMWLLLKRPSTAPGCEKDQCIWLDALPMTGQLDAGLQGAVYMLSEGPLAAALIPWQCSWVMDSASHTISVLIHLLPGLAMFAHRWLAPGIPLDAALYRLWSFLTWDPSKGALRKGGQDTTHFLNVDGGRAQLVWLLGVPLGLYCLWQAIYLVVVQLVFRRFILARGYSTSYSSLARRAAKSNNFLNRFVRRGSAARRVILFGLLQLVFTLITFGIGYVTYRSFQAAILWQLIKFVVPLYYGAMYTATKVPADAFRKGVKHLIALQLASDDLLLKESRPMGSDWVPNTRFSASASS